MEEHIYKKRKEIHEGLIKWDKMNHQAAFIGVLIKNS